MVFDALLEFDDAERLERKGDEEDDQIFVILQILVTDQLDAEFFNLLLHARADERVEFVLKFVQRRVRVKLGIARRQFR